MTTETEKNIIKILSRLDIPGNAAKIYIFLLKNGPAGGYNISKVSGVNRAVVYKELERLKSRQLVTQFGISKKKYEAINGSDLLNILKKQNKLEEILLESSVKELLMGADTLSTIKINDYDDLILELQREIINAKKEILLRVWPEEYPKVKPQLETAEKKSVEIQLLSFSALDEPIGRAFTYNIEPSTFKDNWKRGIALSIDNKKVVLGNRIGREPIQGLSTNDPLISEAIRDQILLDLELAKSRKRMSMGVPDLKL